MVRIKHRYMLVNILYPSPPAKKPGNTPSNNDDIPFSVHFRQPTPDQLTPQLLLRLIRDGVANLFGDYGSGKVAGSLQNNAPVKYLSPATSTAIIRCSREHYRLVWAALTFVTRLPKPVDQMCVLQVVRVSGTIRKAEEEAIRRARLHIRRAQRAVAIVSGAIGAVGGGDGDMVDAMMGEGEVEEEDGVGMFGGIEDFEEGGGAEEEEEAE
ncbi:hypothetical protein LTR08_009197 [Meristemomyces frigidus]|nr:hypothetical protein LTR08_009197 [Meristemomyces frigidus]